MRKILHLQSHPILGLLLTAFLFLVLHISFAHQLDHDPLASELCHFCISSSGDGLDTGPALMTVAAFTILIATLTYPIKTILFVSPQYVLAQTRAPPF